MVPLDCAESLARPLPLPLLVEDALVFLPMAISQLNIRKFEEDDDE